VKITDFEAVVQTFHDARIQYLVAGGVAVNAHGYIRFTPNIDLAPGTDPDNIRNAFRALEKLNYYPNTPIDAEAFAHRDQHLSARTVPEAQMLIFHGEDPETTPVNVTMLQSLDFSHKYDQAMQSEVLPGLKVRFLSIPALIRMKQCTGRPRDLDDIQHLQWLEEDYSHIDENDEDFLWSMTSFEGARKMQIVQAKKLSVRKRLEGLDDLRKVSERLRDMYLMPVSEESGAGGRRRRSP